MMRTLARGTNALTAAQPVVTSAVLMRATSPVGRVADNTVLGRQSMDGTLFPLRTRAATTVTVSMQRPVMSASVEGAPARVPLRTRLPRPERELTRRELRHGKAAEVPTRKGGLDDTAVTKVSLEWQDYEVPAEVPAGGRTGDARVETAAAQEEQQPAQEEQQPAQEEQQFAQEEEQQSAQEEECIYRDAEETVPGEIHCESARGLVYVPIEEHYGYALWDTLQKESYTLGGDGKSVFLNIYGWRDLAVLMTKELHGDLLLRMWKDLKTHGDTRKVRREVAIKEALELEMVDVRQKVQQCVNEVRTAREWAEGAEQGWSQAKAQNDQQQAKIVSLEKEAEECIKDAQDEVRRYGLLEDRLHELQEAAEVDRAKLLSLFKRGQGPMSQRRTGRYRC
jgi:hypothetical protein